MGQGFEIRFQGLELCFSGPRFSFCCWFEGCRNLHEGVKVAGPGALSHRLDVQREVLGLRARALI